MIVFLLCVKRDYPVIILFILLKNYLYKYWNL